MSVSAGTAALTSAFHALEPWRVVIAVGFVVVLAWGNLRGLRESGRIFAIPTYLYVAGMAVVVLWGIWRWAFGGLGPIQYTPSRRASWKAGAALVPVSLFLILHAFSAGVTALTGVEAISNGVSAFKEPRPATPAPPWSAWPPSWPSCSSASPSWPPVSTPAHSRDGNPTLVAQLAQHVLATRPPSSPSRSPPCSSWSWRPTPRSPASRCWPPSPPTTPSCPPAAQARPPPRLLQRHPGPVGAAVFLVIAFEADTHHLIPLYAIGVVTSFTLSQSGMARRHLRLREPGWRKAC